MRIPKRSLRLGVVAVPLVVVAALLLAACGGEGEGAYRPNASTITDSSAVNESAAGESGGASEEAAASEQPVLSDEEQIVAAIEDLLVSPDSERVCNEVLTENLLVTAYGDLQGCLNGRGAKALAESAGIEGFYIGGHRATATAVPSGGVYDGITLDIEAVRDGGAWRIDVFTADVPVGP